MSISLRRKLRADRRFFTCACYAAPRAVKFPPMIRNTNATELLLEGLEQGHRYGLVITGAQSAVALEFRHLDDPTWYGFPGAAMDAVGGVVSIEFFCVTPVMRIRLAAPQDTHYRISVICAAAATF